MKKAILYAAALLFLLFLSPLSALSQGNAEQEDENLKVLEAARHARVAEYGEKKAEFELQLAKLIKDRKIAANDNNSSLEDKRTFEILNLRKQIKALNKEYGIDDDIPQKSEASGKKKSEPVIDTDFYARELAREKLKMEGGYVETAGVSDAPVKKTVPAKKKSPAKKKK